MRLHRINENNIRYVVKSLVIEVVLTFVFVIAILGVTLKVENSAVAGIVIEYKA